MHVGRKSAFVLLSIVVLWAATPALACLMPMAHGSCCQGMAMQDCASQAMVHCGDCCRVQPTQTPLLPGSAGAANHAVGSVPAAARTGLAVPLDVGSATVFSSEAPPPPGALGLGSVLRI